MEGGTRMTPIDEWGALRSAQQQIGRAILIVAGTELAQEPVHQNV